VTAARKPRLPYTEASGLARLGWDTALSSRLSSTNVTGERMSLRPITCSAILALLALAGCFDDALGAESGSLGSSLAAESPNATFIILYRGEWVPFSYQANIQAAGGSVVAAYPELGVAIARSSRASFAGELSKHWSVAGVAATTGAGISGLSVHFGLDRTPRNRPPPMSLPGDPLSPMQWNMRQIHADQARAITPGRKSVVVGIMDSGIDDNLPDLQGQVDHARSVTCVGGRANSDPARWSSDEIGHGTHMAGIIGAKQNGMGVVGIAPGVTLAAVKVTDDGFVYPEAFICGLSWAASHDFALANASLIIDPWYFNCPSDPAQRTISTAVQRAISFAARRGVTVVAAASNEQQDLSHPALDPFSPTDGESVPREVTNACRLLPVELDGVIGVSAVGSDRRLAYYSNYGLDAVDLTAPGGDFHVPTEGNDSGQVVSAIPAYSFLYAEAVAWNGRVGVNCSDGLDPNDPSADPLACEETYALLQGTSISAAHVTGVAALAISRFGFMPTQHLLTRLSRTATPLACPSGIYQPYPDDMPAELCDGTPFRNSFFGRGEVDALAAVR